MPDDIEKINTFLSCPEDIIADGCGVALERIFQQLNTLLDLHKIHLDLLHWKKNPRPAAGGRVQDQINNGLLRICKIYIGILWTRFGSSPGVAPFGALYESGCEEEFYEALKFCEVRWFFICDKPIPPSKIDPKQLFKVKKFCDTLKKQNIWLIRFHDEADLHKKLTEAIKGWLQERITVPGAEKSEAAQRTPEKEEFRKLNKGF